MKEIYQYRFEYKDYMQLYEALASAGFTQDEIQVIVKQATYLATMNVPKGKGCSLCCYTAVMKMISMGDRYIRYELTIGHNDSITRDCRMVYGEMTEKEKADQKVIPEELNCS